MHENYAMKMSIDRCSAVKLSRDGPQEEESNPHTRFGEVFLIFTSCKILKIMTENNRVNVFYCAANYTKEP
jgi:hypothetical protein